MKKFYFWSIVFIFLFSFNLLADTILSEDFEGSVSGWTFGTTGEPNRWFCGTATSHNGNKSAYISNDNGATASYQKTASSTSWLEKSVDLSGYSSATLTFYWKCIGQTGTINRDYGEVYIDNGVNHLVSSVREFAGQSTWIQKSIDISSYVGETVILKFKWVNNNSAGNDPPFCIDDVTITGTVNHDFATLNYNQNNESMKDTTVYIGQQIQFHIVAKNLGDLSENAPIKWICNGGSPLSDTDEYTGTLSPNTETNHIFSPLWTAPSTPGTYTVKFYTELSGDSNTTNDTTTVTINVLDIKNVPYTQSFDSSDFPEGWSYENANDDAATWLISGTYPHSSDYNAVITKIATHSSDDWLYSCPLRLYASKTYRISFWSAIDDETDPQDLEIYYGTDANHTTMTSSQLFNEQISSKDYRQYECYLTPASDGVYYIGWHAYGNSGSSLLHLDDVKISERFEHDFATYDFYETSYSMRDMVVATGESVPVKIYVRNLGTNTESGTVKWIASGGSPLTVTESTSSLLPDTFSNHIFATNWIAPSTEGEYTMQLICEATSDEDTSNNSITIHISVVNPSNVPISQNFDGETAPTLPFGWSIENTNRDYREWQVAENGPNSSPNCIKIVENSTIDMDDWLFSEPISLVASKTYNLSFYYRSGGLNEDLDVFLGTSASSNGMSSTALYSLSTNDASYNQAIVSFSPSSTGVYYLGWHGKTSAGGAIYSELAIDDISITEEAIHDFAVLSFNEDNNSMENFTTTTGSSIQLHVVVKNMGTYTESAVIKWTASGGTPLTDADETTAVLSPQETEHHIFSPNWTAPSTAGTYTINFICDLTNDANETNDIYSITVTVLDNCDILPISEGFESGFDKFENDNETNTNWVLNNELYHSGSYSAWNQYNANDNNILIQSCVMDLSAYQTPYLTFWQIAKTEGGEDNCYVEISTDLGENWEIVPMDSYYGSGTTYSSLGYFNENSYSLWKSSDTPTNSWWQKEIFDLSSYNSENEVMIRFRLSSNITGNDYGWLLDDIEIKELNLPEKPYSPNPENYATNVCKCLNEISWKNGFGTSSVDLYFDEDYSNVENMNASCKVISNQNVNLYDVTDILQGGTDYFWRVVSNNSNGFTVGDIWRFSTVSCDESRFEGFENGNFSAFPWDTSGDQDWFVQDSIHCGGNYSAQSGAISDNQTSDLSVDLNLTQSGYISFCYKIDSEDSNDKLIFYIDGVEKGNWSGNIDYGEARFYVDSGLRTFKWSYKKNGSVSQGKDAAWLDCICFPPFISAQPDAPSNLTITIDNNNVILSWDRVDSAIQYNIYRSENPTTGFVLYDTSSVTSYIDQGAVADGKNYFYYITTVNSAR